MLTTAMEPRQLLVSRPGSVWLPFGPAVANLSLGAGPGPGAR